MTARVPLAIALALATPILLAETAKPRDGSSSSHSSSADRHPSPSSSSHSSSSSTSSDSHSSSSSSSTPRTDAQARHPRPGSGHGRRSYGGYSYRPYGYGGYYGGYYRYGYPYYYGYGFGWDSYYSPPYYPYHNSYRDYGSLRVMVEPNKTRVYVDGYFAGVADDFDGIFQRLNVSPGRHEVTLKLEGYRSHRVRLYVPEDHTIKLRHDMVRGEGEDALDDRVGGPEHRWRDDARDDRRADADADRDDDDREPAASPSARRDDDDDDEAAADAATLRLSVTPDDASIYVDGRFRGTGRQLDDLLMPPGRHRVEVVRPGFRTYDQELDVRGEEPLDVKIALDRL